MEISWDHIHIRCQDLEKAEKFYTEIMGGEVTERMMVRKMPIIRVAFGKTIISLSPKRAEMEEMEPLTGLPRWGAWQLGFEVDDIHKAYEHFKARGAEFRSEPALLEPNFWAAFVLAPDGVEIELMQTK